MHHATQIKLEAPGALGKASTLLIHEGGVEEEVLNPILLELFAPCDEHHIFPRQTAASDYVTLLVKTF